MRGPELGFTSSVVNSALNQEDKGPKKRQGPRRTGRHVVRIFETGKQVPT